MKGPRWCFVRPKVKVRNLTGRTAVVSWWQETDDPDLSRNSGAAGVNASNPGDEARAADKQDLQPSKIYTRGCTVVSFVTIQQPSI